MKRIIGVGLALLLAGVGTLVLVVWVQSAEDRALAGEEVVDVLVVTQEIERGTAAEDIAQAVALEQVPLKVRAEGSVSELDALDGLVAAVDLLPGEQLTAARFLNPVEAAAQTDVDVPEGLQEVTISLEPQRAVGGTVRPGDTVGVVASFDPFDLEGVILEDGTEVEPGTAKTGNTSHFILHKVLVTNVQVEQLPQTTEPSDDDAVPQPDLAPTGNLLITLALDAPAVERVVFAAEFGSVWLSAEPENASVEGTRIQTRGTIYE